MKAREFFPPHTSLAIRSMSSRLAGASAASPVCDVLEARQSALALITTEGARRLPHQARS